VEFKIQIFQAWKVVESGLGPGKSWVGTVENHDKKMVKTWQTFVKIAKVTAKTRHQITDPKTSL